MNADESSDGWFDKWAFGECGLIRVPPCGLMITLSLLVTNGRWCDIAYGGVTPREKKFNRLFPGPVVPACSQAPRVGLAGVPGGAITHASPHLRVPTTSAPRPPQ